MLCCNYLWDVSLLPVYSSLFNSFPTSLLFLFVVIQAKAVIRELLPGGLRESISKVRSSVAYAVSAIAHWDWPEAWPQLFSLLMEMLVSGDVNAVHGAMRVLTGTEPFKLI